MQHRETNVVVGSSIRRGPSRNVAARRPPRLGTKTAAVYIYLQENGPFPSSAEIARRSGLSLREVRLARARLFRHRHLPTPTAEEWREELRHTRGSLWPLIGRYARMGMTPREVQVASALCDLQALPYARVENALNKAWKQGLLPRRTETERRTSRLDALHRDEQAFRMRIMAWLEVAAQYIRWVLPDEPRSRAEWLDLADRELERQRAPGATPAYAWQLLSRLCLRRGMVLMSNDRLTVARLQREDECELNQLLGGSSALLPADELGRSYLFDAYLARQRWSATGDRSELNNFPSFYEEQEPDIAVRLAPSTAYLRTRTPTMARVPRALESALVQYADTGTE